MQIFRGVYVDSFKVRKNNSIHFLTHWHSDHYDGITAKWNYGPIFCSVMTRKILLTKYPKLSSVAQGLNLNQTYTLTNDEGIQYKVIMFDSNHIAGSVIILFQIPNGNYVLHTGDMRFNSHCLTNNKQLFHLDANGKYQCNYQIDTLYLDNTYCDPIFMFPNRSDALRMIADIIDKNQPGSRTIYIVTDSIGKQQAFVGLSLRYQVPVTLHQERFDYAQQMFDEPLFSQIFCHKKNAQKRGSWIQVIKRGMVQKLLQQNQKAIAIKLTGWANLQDSYPLSPRQFIVPYSLHSNYNELQLFMSVVRPKNLFPVVRPNYNASNKFRQNIHSYGSYFGSLMHMKQRGFSFFAANYVQVGFTRKSFGKGTNAIKQEKENYEDNEQQGLQACIKEMEIGLNGIQNEEQN